MEKNEIITGAISTLVFIILVIILDYFIPNIPAILFGLFLIGYMSYALYKENKRTNGEIAKGLKQYAIIMSLIILYFWLSSAVPEWKFGIFITAILLAWFFGLSSKSTS
jgi:uncharacterized membrane protein